MFKKETTLDDVIKVHPELALERKEPVDKDLITFKCGDILVEDRGSYINTVNEAPGDREHPQTTLEVLEVHPDKGVYWLWNHNRQIHTLGYIELMASAPEGRFTLITSEGRT